MGCFVGRTWKIKIDGVPNGLNYCVTFMVYTTFANMAAVRMMQRGGPHEARGLETHAVKKPALFPGFFVVIRIRFTTCKDET